MDLITGPTLEKWIRDRSTNPRTGSASTECLLEVLVPSLKERILQALLMGPRIADVLCCREHGMGQ